MHLNVQSTVAHIIERPIWVEIAGKDRDLMTSLSEGMRCIDHEAFCATDTEARMDERDP